MASYHQVRDSCSTNIRHGCSTAQMCLHKILSIISSIPPYETPKEASLHLEISDSEPKGSGNNRGVGIDLNLRLGTLVGVQESESLAENGNLSACSFVGKAAESDSVAESTKVLAADKSSEGECDPKETAVQVVADKDPEDSEITNQGVESSEIYEETEKIKEEEEENEGVGEDEGVKAVPLERGENKSNDCLGLLVEAAKLISGNFGDDQSDGGEKQQSGESRRTPAAGNESSRSGGSKRKKKQKKKSWRVVDWLGDLDDTSPVVRSKRGRTQVLPTRYRDSVLDPWKPLPRPQRSSATATATATTTTTTTTATRINRRSR